MRKLLREFRDFAMRGNVVDLAVGLIIGVAFGVIVTSLVKDVLMPPLGYAIGRVDFNDLGFTLKEEVRDETTQQVTEAAVVIGYGKFINATIQFVIQAAAVFLILKLMSTLKRKPAAAPPGPPPPPPPDVLLLTEIRDLLKARG